MSIISVHWSSLISVKWTTGWMPALLTSPSMRPWSSAAWTTRSAAPGSVRSAETAPSAPRCSTGEVRVWATTVAPAAMSRRAIPPPIPPPAPVTTITRPSSRIISLGVGRSVTATSWSGWLCRFGSARQMLAACRQASSLVGCVGSDHVVGRRQLSTGERPGQAGDVGPRSEDFKRLADSLHGQARVAKCVGRQGGAGESPVVPAVDQLRRARPPSGAGRGPDRRPASAAAPAPPGSSSSISTGAPA